MPVGIQDAAATLKKTKTKNGLHKGNTG